MSGLWQRVEENNVKIYSESSPGALKETFDFHKFAADRLYEEIKTQIYKELKLQGSKLELSTSVPRNK